LILLVYSRAACCWNLRLRCGDSSWKTGQAR